MSGLLETWLERATRRLSRASNAQARAEIQSHYESACEAAIAGGSNAEEADRAAMESLGNAAAANREYRKVLLTSWEAEMLRETSYGVWAGAKRWLFLLPTMVLMGGIRFLATGDRYLGGILLLGAVGLVLLFAAPKLPIYTTRRGRVFRAFRLLWLAALMTLALKGSWLVAPVVLPLAWAEWTLASVRRKIPVADWPKQLYL